MIKKGTPNTGMVKREKLIKCIGLVCIIAVWIVAIGFIMYKRSQNTENAQDL